MNEAARRSAGKWAILMAAWVVGLAVFALYLALIVYLVYHWLS